MYEIPRTQPQLVTCLGYGVPLPRRDKSRMGRISSHILRSLSSRLTVIVVLAVVELVASETHHRAYLY
jgi:hypothetical protein